MTPPQINLNPASYASTAAAATNTKNNQSRHLETNAQLPAITEIHRVLQKRGAGGHADPQLELSIRARAADAIVREVRLKMASTVPNPIPTQSGTLEKRSPSQQGQLRLLFRQ